MGSSSMLPPSGARDCADRSSYQSQSAAQSAGIISETSSYVRFGADSTQNVASGARGRMSVRLESTTTYNRGLFVLDADHMPGEACGVWPSWFTYGPNWPANGEIGTQAALLFDLLGILWLLLTGPADVIEYVNFNTDNLYSLHSEGPQGTCALTPQKQLGTTQTTDCGYYLSNGGTDGTGCGIAGGTSNNIGTNFNAGGGGVYVMQWTANNIKTWFFPRANVPSSLLPGATPNLCQFGTPDAVFNGCPFNTYFQDQTIAFTNTFCGDWGESTNGVLARSNAGR